MPTTTFTELLSCKWAGTAEFRAVIDSLFRIRFNTRSVTPVRATDEATKVRPKEAPAGHKCGVHAPSAFANDRAGVEGCSWPAEESLSEPDVSARLEVGEAGRAVARRLLFRSLALSLRLARTSRARVRKARGFIST